MHDKIGAKELRHDLRRILDHVLVTGARLMILRNGRAVAALVPPAELRALEKADASRMAFHEEREQAQLREVRWLKEGLDGARYEEEKGAD